MEPTAPCPCHSGEAYHNCCQPYHNGKVCPSAQSLMRSRYAAYALGLSDYIMDTTDPKGPLYQAHREAWRKTIDVFSQQCQFESLRILGASEGKKEAYVTFYAGLSEQGKDVSFAERSRFIKRGGRWYYHSGSHTGS
ncbi:MAG: SEC-C domain-containing protein [Chlamydiia bacterium]|nr:SEC-C domain-containing protein [Chlamydiia bacterium]